MERGGKLDKEVMEKGGRGKRQGKEGKREVRRGGELLLVRVDVNVHDMQSLVESEHYSLMPIDCISKDAGTPDTSFCAGLCLWKSSGLQHFKCSEMIKYAMEYNQDYHK